MMCNRAAPTVEGWDQHTLERRRTHWQRSGFSLEADTRVAEDDAGRIVGYAALNTPAPPSSRVRGDLYVDPAHEFSSLARTLLDWIHERARELALATPAGARMIVTHHVLAQDTQRRDLCLSAGYALAHHSLRMRTDLDEVPPSHVPQGITFRTVSPKRDLPVVSRIVQEAFRHHHGFVRRSLADDVARYEQWLADDPRLDPDVWHLACAEKDAVGVCLGTTRYSGDKKQAYVYTLGVRDAWRGQGIGQALLLHAFAVFRVRGNQHVDLDVDTANLTGALRLYKTVGMRTRWQIDEYEKRLYS